MTKRTKYILLAVSGLGLAVGVLIVGTVLIISIAFLSVPTGEAKSDNPVKIKKQPKKPDNSKIDSTKIDSKGKNNNENKQASEDDEERAPSKNDSDEAAQVEAEGTTAEPDLDNY